MAIKAYTTNLLGALDLIKKDRSLALKQYEDNELEGFITEIELHKNNKDGSCPDDSLVFYSKEGEKWIRVDQINYDTYHTSLFCAKLELGRLLGLHKMAGMQL